MRTAFAIAALLFTLAACGGGGSPSSMVQPASVIQAPPPPAAMEARAAAMESQANAILARTTNAPSVNNAAQQEDDENIWELVAKAYELLAEAARIRAEAARVAGNDEAAEAWTIVAERLAIYNSSLTEIADNGTIATSFGFTKLDHYPLNASHVSPEAEIEADIAEIEADIAAIEADIAAIEAEAAEARKAGAEELVEELTAIAEEGAAAVEALTADVEALTAAAERLTLDDPDQLCCWEMIKEESEIASRAEVFAMLEENAFSVPSDDGHGPIEESIYLHKSPPTVRFMSEQPAPAARAATLRAIDNINAWLPYDKHITVGEDVPLAILVNYELELNKVVRTLPSTVFWDDGDVGYYPEELRPGLSKSFDKAATAFNNLIKEGNIITVDLDSGVGGGYAGGGGFTGIHIHKDYSTNTAIIQHELLHALGMNGGKAGYIKFGRDFNKNSAEGPQSYYSHVLVSQFPESDMAYDSPYYAIHGLSQIDGETIQVLYTKLLSLGDEYTPYSLIYDPIRGAVVLEHDDFSMNDLGPWDDGVIRYAGRIESLTTDYYGTDEIEAAFGVDWRNGMARPWADGWATEGTFAGSGLSGTATWAGELVGFTPTQEAVHGDSAIEVDLGRMTGEAAFTALEHWNAGARPGARGTGAQWNDGDLHYSLGLDGNYLRSNGGDDGYVSGRFVGDQHEGVVGILERPDLTGAFGGTR